MCKSESNSLVENRLNYKCKMSQFQFQSQFWHDCLKKNLYSYPFNIIEGEKKRNVITPILL